MTHAGLRCLIVDISSRPAVRYTQATRLGTNKVPTFKHLFSFGNLPASRIRLSASAATSTRTLKAPLKARLFILIFLRYFFHLFFIPLLDVEATVATSERLESSPTRWEYDFNHESTASRMAEQRRGGSYKTSGESSIHRPCRLGFRAQLLLREETRSRRRFRCARQRRRNRRKGLFEK